LLLLLDWHLCGVLVVHGVSLGVIFLHVLFLAVAALISVLRSIGLLFLTGLLLLFFLLLSTVLLNEVFVLIK
jgi:hypothetical protein